MPTTVIGVVSMTAALALSGCRDRVGNEQTFCAQLRRVPVITERDDLTVPDPAAATGELVTELRRLRESAPQEIRGDVSVLVGVAEDVATALSAGDLASMEAAKQRVATSQEAWKAASDNVVSYASTVCNVELGREQ
ncbi:MAG: hypothetical protein IT196_23275 [Acidimicrobiales bacterium]|nr:hypothetical protein [Acidimicrobiales bacterium]